MELRKSPYSLFENWINKDGNRQSDKRLAVITNSTPYSVVAGIKYIDDAGIIFQSVVPVNGKCCLFLQLSNGKQVTVVGQVQNVSESAHGNYCQDSRYSGIPYYSLKKIVALRGLNWLRFMLKPAKRVKARSFYLNHYILIAESFTFINMQSFLPEQREYTLINNKWLHS